MNQFSNIIKSMNYEVDVTELSNLLEIIHVPYNCITHSLQKRLDDFKDELKNDYVRPEQSAIYKEYKSKLQRHFEITVLTEYLFENPEHYDLVMSALHSVTEIQKYFMHNAILEIKDDHLEGEVL